MEIIVGIVRGLLTIVSVLFASYAIPYMAARGVVEGINAAGGINHSVTVDRTERTNDRN